MPSEREKEKGGSRRESKKKKRRLPFPKLKKAEGKRGGESPICPQEKRETRVREKKGKRTL